MYMENVLKKRCKVLCSITVPAAANTVSLWNTNFLTYMFILMV